MGLRGCVSVHAALTPKDPKEQGSSHSGKGNESMIFLVSIVEGMFLTWKVERPLMPLLNPALVAGPKSHVSLSVSTLNPMTIQVY